MPSTITVSEFDVDLSCVEWGIKTSLRDYVASLDDGRIEWSMPAAEAAFPCRSISREPDGDALVVVADGGIRFFGHDGLMDIALRDIMVRIAGEALSVSVSERHRVGSLVIAEQDGIRCRITDREIVVVADELLLTSRGAALFGGVYARGTALDPLRIVVAR